MSDKPSRTRVLKRRVQKRGTVVASRTDVNDSEKLPSKNIKQKKNLTGLNKGVKEKAQRALDRLDNSVYSPVQIDSSSNNRGSASFKISKESLDKIVSLFSPMSNKVEKNLLFSVTSENVIVAQEQEGVTAIGYITVDFDEVPKKDITFVIAKEVVKQLSDVVADFAVFNIDDANLEIMISDTVLELGTEETSDIMPIDLDLEEYEEFEYLNADIINDVFGRAKAIRHGSAGIFEPTVTIGKSIHCGSSVYLTEIKDVFKNFEVNCSPDFIPYILNVAKNSKKDVKFAKTDDYFIVVNDNGMIYKTNSLHIKFPTDISEEFLPSRDTLSNANFDSKVLTTSLSKLTIALLGMKSSEIEIKFSPKKQRADVSVTAINNKKSTDYWNSGVMDKAVIPSFSVSVALLLNTISILDNNITITVYDDFVAVSDEKQIILLSMIEK